jgi:hypothetical protein
MGSLFCEASENSVGTDHDTIPFFGANGVTDDPGEMPNFGTSRGTDRP